MCEEIGKNFNKLKSELISKSDDQVTVKMLQFIKKEEQTRKGNVVKRLKAESVEANVSWVLNFLEELLPKIIHHRNLFKNYRTNLDTVINSIENITEVGLDFSENITLPVNKEPQSLHWAGCKEQKTVHSGITKVGGTKNIPPLFVR